MIDHSHTARQYLLAALTRMEQAGYLSDGNIVQKQWNVEAKVSDGERTANVLVYFNSKGILTPKVQGKEGAFLGNVRALLTETKYLTSPIVPEGVEQWIGVDESGKGDYFGPLVTAGVVIGPATLNAMRELNIRDSKDLKDAAMFVIAGKLETALGDAKELIVTMPEKYNDLMAKPGFGGNSQRLLAWQHARAIENLLERHPETKYAVCDKFGNESVIRSALMTKGRTINVIQETKAERDPAVAAASILARIGFLRGMEKLEKQAGVRLPIGASDEKGILLAMKSIIAKEGRDGLRRYAKLHFKTTEKLLGKGM